MNAELIHMGLVIEAFQTVLRIKHDYAEALYDLGKVYLLLIKYSVTV
jgi:hypothetical protein